jgi:hypothetical protein
MKKEKSKKENMKKEGMKKEEISKNHSPIIKAFIGNK